MGLPAPAKPTDTDLPHWPIHHHSPYKACWKTGNSMGALANQMFAKMNGIGNEIVVVDLRSSSAIVTSEEARAVASPAGVHYDQLIGLQPPRLQGTQAFIPIYHNHRSQPPPPRPPLPRLLPLLF